MTLKHIVLIGMPSSGKSSIGKILADKLRFNFIDGDDLLVERFGKKLSEIISEVGEERFIELEGAEFLHLGLEKPTVLAPGGSLVYSHEAMLHLTEIAEIIYLDTPLREIEMRIPDSVARGIIGAKDKTLAQLYDERVVLYKKYATKTVDNAKVRPTIVAERILAII